MRENERNIADQNDWINKMWNTYLMKWPEPGPTINGLLGRAGIKGVGQCDPNTADCSVSFFSMPYWFKNYNVIDTDYDNYSIVYYCDRHTQL